MCQFVHCSYVCGHPAADRRVGERCANAYPYCRRVNFIGSVRFTNSCTNCQNAFNMQLAANTVGQAIRNNLSATFTTSLGNMTQVMVKAVADSSAAATISALKFAASAAGQGALNVGMNANHLPSANIIAAGNANADDEADLRAPTRDSAANGAADGDGSTAGNAGAEAAPEAIPAAIPQAAPEAAPEAAIEAANALIMLGTTGIVGDAVVETGSALAEGAASEADGELSDEASEETSSEEHNHTSDEAYEESSEYDLDDSE